MPWQRGTPVVFGNHARMLTPKPMKIMQRDIKRAAHTAIRVGGFECPLIGALCCSVVAVFPRIKAMPQRDYAGRQWRPIGADVDNVAKLVLDALNEVAYLDDRQIVNLQSQTVYAAAGEHAAIEVYLWRAPTFPSTSTEALPQTTGAT